MKQWFFASLLPCLVWSMAAAAQESPLLATWEPKEPVRIADDDKGIFNVILENDYFTGTDRGYTNGVRFSWLSSEKNSPEWVQDLASYLPLMDDTGKKRISVALGQNIYAPDDITRAVPNPNDRPYAGWLYGSVGILSDTGTTLDNVLLTVGVVGPASHAAQTQKFVHEVIDDQHPNGWAYQLNNEPGVMLTYERKWRGLVEANAFGLGADVMPHVGVNLGNINTSASVGTTLRLGYDLPADYGPPRIRPSLPGSDFFIPTKELSGYLFTTIEGRGVARDIFLDGNTFEDGPSVDKKNWTGSLQVGAAVTYGDARLSYTQVFLTKQFETESKAEKFGVVTLSYRF